MNVKKNEFKQLDIESKADQIIMYNKNYLKLFGILPNYYYIFDKKNNLYAISIDKSKFMKNPDLSKMLKNVIINKISEIEDKNNTSIIRTLFIFKSFYNPVEDYENSIDIHKKDENESLTILSESNFEYKIDIYDRISIDDNGKKFSVISNNPVKKLEYSKLDPDIIVKGLLVDVLK